MSGHAPTTGSGPAGGADLRMSRGGAGDRSVSWLMGTALVLATTAATATAVPALRHWFLLPVTMCGLLVVPDAVDWARGRLDTFDPQAMVGLVGTHFFYVAPQLHVVWDWWARYVPGPDDWRSALGEMAVLNLLGLLLYRAVLAPRFTRPAAPFPVTDVKRLSRTAIAVAVAGALTFVALVIKMGGPASYLATMADDRQQLKGLGLTLLVSAAFPTAILILVLVRRQSFFRRRPVALVPVLVVYGLAELLVAGLGGSRSHTVWCVVIGVGTCHFLIKAIRRSTIMVLAVVLVGFLYFYGFYKANGTQALEALDQGTSLSELSSDTGRDMRFVLLGDLGRADVQALLLQRQREGRAPVEYGLTYLGDLAFLVPDSLGLGNVPNKVVAGTNMLYGADTYAPDFTSSWVYGLAGDALLNFGPIGAVLAFLPFAMIVRWAASFCRRCLASRQAPGVALVAPCLALAVPLVLTSDLDNLAFFAVNFASLSTLLALASRSRGDGRDLHRVPGVFAPRLPGSDGGIPLALPRIR